MMWQFPFVAALVLGVVAAEETTVASCDSHDCFNTTDSDWVGDDSLGSTEISSGSTEAASSTTANVTTTAQTPTTSPTPSPTSTTPKRPDNEHDPCSCDVTRWVCDINCCCDVDCSESDRKAFSRCIPEPEVDHSGLCYKQQFIYSNNTRYKVIQQEKGIFCIARDNFPERLFFSDQKTFHTPSSFNRALKRKKQFTWQVGSLPQNEKFQSTLPYRSGVPVWLYINDTGSISTLEVPLTVGAPPCRGSRVVRYLENFESRCLRGAVSRQECEDPLTTLNGQSFCENVNLISTPTLVNQTKIEDNLDEVIVTMRPMVCGRSGGCLEVKHIRPPTYNSESGSCDGVVTQVRYVIHHNSTRGIVDAECQLVLGNISMGGSSAQLHQVVFRWARNETSAFPRSGTPGYQLGRPLISGSLVEGSGSKSRKLVKTSSSFDDWVSLPGSDQAGDCSGRRNLRFKENLRTQCVVRMSRESLLSQQGCTALSEQVWRTVFGDMQVNRSDRGQLLTLVSSFGDPAPDQLDDWVPIFLDRPLSDQPAQVPCTNQIGGVHYRALYSNFGPFSGPQMKIVGLLAVVGSTKVECKTSGCHMKTVSSASFLDVSQPAVNRFAKAPVIKIRLPPDFFYPFSSGCSNVNTDIIVIIIALVPIASLTT